MAIVIFITVQFFHTQSRRSMLVGILCCIFGIIMYGSPLTIMGRIVLHVTYCKATPREDGNRA
ncbi:hypothetical protein RJ641_018828 [Dillenia turbinata]|uniref:Uncharacterized protein n=1 Tax=Dillenia turbinata TaxID=194707 RepID=A0AAN8USM4_9MAGN